MIRRDARFFAFAEAFFFAAANGIADGFISPIGGFDVDGATAHRRAVVLFDSFLVTAFDFNVSRIVAILLESAPIARIADFEFHIRFEITEPMAAKLIAFAIVVFRTNGDFVSLDADFVDAQFAAPRAIDIGGASRGGWRTTPIDARHVELCAIVIRLTRRVTRLAFIVDTIGMLTTRLLGRLAVVAHDECIEVFACVGNARAVGDGIVDDASPSTIYRFARAPWGAMGSVFVVVFAVEIVAKDEFIGAFTTR